MTKCIHCGLEATVELWCQDCADSLDGSVKDAERRISKTFNYQAQVLHDAWMDLVHPIEQGLTSLLVRLNKFLQRFV